MAKMTYTGSRHTKYLVFKEYQQKHKKTMDIEIFNLESLKTTQHLLLGRIYWRAGWRKYVCEPQGHMIFDAKCLQEITDYLNLLMEERKDGKTKVYGFLK